MTTFGMRLLAGTAFCALALSAVEAQAGAFGIREQSTEGIGEAYAGVAAGGAPSSMFWNPATMTQQRGLSVETDFTGIFPNAKIYSSPFPASTFGAGSPLATLSDPQDNVGLNAAVPAGYVMMQMRPDLWLGVSINSPIGLSTGFQNSWEGRFYGLESTFHSYNATPSIAYQVNEWLSIGAGIQLQYADTNLNMGLPLPGNPAAGIMNLSGRGWGFGFTAGATVTPWAGTQLGLGYRSAINQDISGTMLIPALPASTPGAISTTLQLPDIATAGIRQRVTDAFTLLGTVEWDRWSRIGTSTVSSGIGGPAFVAGVPVALPFDYRDGWLFSGGAEYAPAPGWILRAGAGYEISPISDTVRTPALPDSNRIWTSVGLSKTIIPGLSLDVAYAHLFMQQANIAITPTSGNPWFNGVSYTGSSSPSIDIFSVGLRLQVAPPPPAAKPLITKG